MDIFCRFGIQRLAVILTVGQSIYELLDVYRGQFLDTHFT